MSKGIWARPQRAYFSRPAEEQFHAPDGSDLLAYAMDLQERSTNIVITAPRIIDVPCLIETETDGEVWSSDLAIELPDGEPAPMTATAFDQLAGMLPAPPNFLRRLTPAGITAVMEDLRTSGKIPAIQVLRTQYDQGGLIRAVNTTTYMRTMLFPLLSEFFSIILRHGLSCLPTWETAREGVGRTGSAWASERDALALVSDQNASITLPRTERGEDNVLYPAAIFHATDTGFFSVEFALALVVAICGNFGIDLAEDLFAFKFRHRGAIQDRLKQAFLILDALLARKAHLTSAEGQAALAFRAHDILLPGDFDAAGGIVRTDRDKAVELYAGKLKGYNPGTLGQLPAVLGQVYDRAVEEESTVRTLWTFSQGATAYARDAKDRGEAIAWGKLGTKLVSLAA